MESLDLQNRIAAFLRDANPSAAGDGSAIADSTDLFADGWMDSLLQLRLLAFLESELSVRVPPFQVTRRSFASVSGIMEMLQRNRPSK